MQNAAFQLFRGTLLATCAGSYARFRAALAAPREAQDRLLAKLVADLGTTDYGRCHGIGYGDSYERFADKLPIVDYERIEPWLERQRHSAGPVLCPTPVAFYERTSGSAGPSKLIPYTRALQLSFVRMFLLWVYDTFAHGPRLRSGCTFLSVSPNSAASKAPASGIRVGLQDDTEYLPAALRWLVGRYLVLPRGLRAVADAFTFKRIVAAHLLDAPALEVVSVWNPSYLTALLEFIDDNRDVVVADLRAGSIVAGPRVFHLSRGTPARRHHWAERLQSGAVDFKALWPELRLLSCWTDGNAALVLDRLRHRLPQAVVQAKGLIATEGPMTIPLWQSPAPVPLLTEMFFEFIDPCGNVRRLHELETGARYDVVLSQRGGLARYRIGDQVEVVGSFDHTPTLRFLGRASEVSDIVGEKLNETFVRRTLESCSQLAKAHWMLLPSVNNAKAGYVCLVDDLHPPPDLALAVDSGLQRAYQYRLARELGQLAPVAVERCRGLEQAYLDWSVAQGRKLGNIKPCVLLPAIDRAASFLRYVRGLEA